MTCVLLHQNLIQMNTKLSISNLVSFFALIQLIIWTQLSNNAFAYNIGKVSKSKVYSVNGNCCEQFTPVITYT